MQTRLASRSREVVIGPEHPFVVIGERINPTGRKVLQEELKAGDLSRVEADAIAQKHEGMRISELNATTEPNGPSVAPTEDVNDAQ